jgi:hypothetical protein
MVALPMVRAVTETLHAPSDERAQVVEPKETLPVPPLCEKVIVSP